MTKKRKLTTEPPSGLSLYIRRISRRRHGSPAQLAKLFADNGLKWAAFGGPWHDRSERPERYMNKPDTIHAYAEAFAAAGVAPHVWGYPWWDRIDLFLEQMRLCTSEAIVGWVLDPELGLKNHPQEAGDLFRKSRQANPYRLIGMSSYGLPRGHRTFPFEAFAEQGIEGDPAIECDYGSPQLYDTPPGKILRGLREYDDLGFDHIVPSYGVYKFVKHNPSLPLRGSNRKAVAMLPAELDQHLGHFVKSEIPIPGAIGWAENFMNRGLWRVLAEWADLFERGAMELEPA